jgi:hypothetical protein
MHYLLSTLSCFSTLYLDGNNSLALMIVYYLSYLYLDGNQGLSCLPMELEQFKRLQSYDG